MADQREVDLSPEQLAEKHQEAIRRTAAPLITHLGKAAELKPTYDFRRDAFFRFSPYNAIDDKRNKLQHRKERDKYITESTPVHQVFGHVLQTLGVKYDDTMAKYLADLHDGYEPFFEAIDGASVKIEPSSLFNQAVTQLQEYMFDQVDTLFESLVGRVQHFGNFALAQSQLIVEQIEEAA